MPRFLARSIVAIVLLLALAPPAAAADGDVVDEDGLLGSHRASVDAVVDAYAQVTKGRFIVVVRSGDASDSRAVADEARAMLLAAAAEPAIVVLVVVSPDGCPGAAGIATTPGGGEYDVTAEEVAIVRDDLAGFLTRCQVGPGTAIAAARLLSFAVTDEAPSGSGGGGTTIFEAGRTPAPGQPDPGAPAAAPPPGPPFPDPEIDRAVYDFAGVFAPETIASAEATIDAIEARTGAEVVVYSQVVDYGITVEEADAHAEKLMDQWGIGRRGFDDGLVILFDLDPSLRHGQVQLYGGPGYRAAFLDNSEKQRIFDEDMVPRLEVGDLDGALLVALERVDANATPEHAARLQTFRQLDAAMGLVGAPVILFTLVGSAVFAWLRYGRDPVYLDDPSIHMAGPPRDLTPAAAAFVISGAPNRRALTSALLDLASRGEISFREEKTLFGFGRKVGIQLDPGAGDAVTEAQRARNAGRPLGPAERVARDELAKLGKGESGYIKPEELLKFGTSVDDFNEALEAHALRMGWFREKPSTADARWATRGVIALVLGFVAFFGAVNLPSSGLTLIAAALVVGGGTVLVISRSMEAVTIPGAMIRAMLAAYRRTLQKTMAQSRSMDQVVAKSGLDWLETPDQAVVWGTALGLEKDVEDVLERSVDDVKDGRAAAGAVYVPTWYGTGGSAGWGASAGGGGLVSSSAIPDIGGMMSALGSIGNSPSSSGSGGGGGFGGGGSGGGGGGSGGGF